MPGTLDTQVFESRSRRFSRFRPSSLDVLGIRDFRWFVASAAFADLGISFRVVVTGWVVLELTDSAAWVGLLRGQASTAMHRTADVSMWL